MKRFEKIMRDFFELDDVEPQELIEDYMVEVSKNDLVVQDERDMAYYFFEYANTDYDDDIEEAVIVEDEDNTVLEMVKVKPKSKRDELLESLSYLKSKKDKSKQDRESIYTLEMVLKNMK
jgi:hypothetical protein